MLFMLTTWACEMGLPLETGIPGFWDSTVPVSCRTGRKQFIPPHPSMGQRNWFQSQGAIQAPSAAQMGQKGQSVGRGQGHGSQAETSSKAGQKICYFYR